MGTSSIPRIDLTSLAISQNVLKLVSYDVMKRHLLIPFDFKNDRLSVAMAEPENMRVLQQIRTVTGFDVDVFATHPGMILKTLERLFNVGSVKPFNADLDLQISAEDSPIAKTADKLFEMALKARASDIHLEPQAQGLFVRFRIDGVLHTIHAFSKTISVAVTARIKVMAEMDISEKRLPLDGQINVIVEGRELDLRVSTLPGKYGEKVVIRLLDKSTGALDMSLLGMDAVSQSRFEMMVEKPQGLVLVTGPTGSGKSTTLYAVLNRLKSPLKNIITLEDPIEYELLAASSNESGVTQVQINPKIGLTFASALRASLRQDPDVLMVGEIRDKETAEVAMKAAMTGHLVLSTLHTNDSAQAVGRLRDIGIEPYLIASTLTGVIAQRLLRLLCPHCKEGYQPPARALASMFPQRTLKENTQLYRPKGCASCQGTGYWGRKGIYELLPMSDDLRQLIHENASIDAIKKLALGQGLLTLRDSGLDLVLQGLTTVEEVFRHTVE